MKLIEKGSTQDFMEKQRIKYEAKTGKKLTDRELFDNKDFLKEIDRPMHIALQSGYHSPLLEEILVLPELGLVKNGLLINLEK